MERGSVRKGSLVVTAVLAVFVLFVFREEALELGQRFPGAGTALIPRDSTYVGHNILADKPNVPPEPEPVEGAFELEGGIVQMAHQFVSDRSEAYRDAGLSPERFAMRGVGALAARHGAVLVATLPGGSVEKFSTAEAGTNEVIVTNVAGLGGDGAFPTAGVLTGEDCSLLTIWVRVDGPEIFAGKAKMVPQLVPSNDKWQPCQWSFPFDLAIPGDYRVDAKLLLWNGAVEFDGMTQCAEQTKEENGTAVMHEYPQRAGFKGFKMYDPVLACCEICTRLGPGCRQWATPPLQLPQPSLASNGCDLFFGNDTDPALVPVSHLIPNATVTLPYSGRRQRIMDRRLLGAAKVKQMHGAPYELPTMQFLGCGWSYHYTLDFPCLSGNLDDRVPMSARSFTLPPAVGELDPVEDPQLPLCTIANEAQGEHYGRWVRAPYPGPEACPEPWKADPQFNTRFDITMVDPHRPNCWHRDNLSVVGHKCMEVNCKLIDPTSRWMSDLHQEKEWYGTWQPYNCRYIEFTNEQLSRCLVEQKISSIRTDGASISQYLNEYLDQRLKDVALYDQIPHSRNIVLSTLRLLARAKLPLYKIEEAFQNYPNSTDFNTWYFTSGLFLSSERDIWTQVERMEELQRLAAKVMVPKGHKMLNAFDMSAAFTYETATQFDGMHIVGPPMKMMITKLFHHICTEDGTVDPILKWGEGG